MKSEQEIREQVETLRKLIAAMNRLAFSAEKTTAVLVTLEWVLGEEKGDGNERHD